MSSQKSQKLIISSQRSQFVIIQMSGNPIYNFSISDFAESNSQSSRSSPLNLAPLPLMSFRKTSQIDCFQPSRSNNHPFSVLMIIIVLLNYDKL